MSESEKKALKNIGEKFSKLPPEGKDKVITYINGIVDGATLNAAKKGEDEEDDG